MPSGVAAAVVVAAVEVEAAAGAGVLSEVAAVARREVRLNDRAVPNGAVHLI